MLAHLHERSGMALWMVTRAVGEEWIVLASEDHGYRIAPGKVMRWSDTFCARMALGEGPRVAPSSDDVTIYRDAPLAKQLRIGAYIAAPLTGLEGQMFGTICAIDPDPQPAELAALLPEVELFAALLSGLLAHELALHAQQRRADLAVADALRDPLTGLVNRRGWDDLLEAEERRCQRHAHGACILVLDIDDLKVVNDTQGHAAGDDLIRRTATALGTACREHDVPSRIGGDEFAVLAIETDLAGGTALARRVERALGEAGIAASIGVAARTPASSLHAALHLADANMYAAKLQRANGRGA